MNVSQLGHAYTDSMRSPATKETLINAGRDRDKHSRQNNPPDGPDVRDAGNHTDFVLNISPDGMRIAGGANGEPEKMASEFHAQMRRLEDAARQGNSEADAMKVFIKCMQIAMRIIKGDDVPQEDHRFLAENDPELYAEAMLRRMPKENPHKYDRLSEDEDTDDFNAAGDAGYIKSISPATGEIAVKSSSGDAARAGGDAVE